MTSANTAVQPVGHLSHAAPTSEVRDLRRRVAELESLLRRLQSTVTSGTLSWHARRPEVVRVSSTLCRALALGVAAADRQGYCRLGVAAIAALVDKRDPNRGLARLREYVKAGGGFKTELRLIIDGIPRWVSVAGQVEFDGGGPQSVSARLSLVDGAEIEAYRARERDARALREAVRHVGVHLWQWSAVGEAPLQITGCDCSGALPTEDDRLRPWREFVHPEDVGPLAEALNGALASPGAFRATLRARFDAGAYRHYDCHGIVEALSAGGHSATGTLFDVEERVRLQRTARANEERLRLVIRGAHAGVFEWPDSGAEPVRMDASMLALLEYEPEDVEQTASWWRGIIHPDDLALVEGNFAACVARGDDYDTTYRIRFRDRGYRMIRALAAIRANGDGHGYRMVGMLIDVEEAHRDKARLEAANEQLRRFSDFVAHDLGATLRHADAFGALLAADYADCLDEVGLDYLRRVREASAMGRAMIDDLLVYARTGTSRMDLRPVALTGLVGEVREALSHDGAADHVTYSIGALPTVRADATQMWMLFQNLLANAIKFTGDTPGAHVRVSARELDEAEVELSVSDNGVGFDPRHRERIFGAFERAHDGSEFKGTGMGLANVARIVHRHGGRVTAEGAPGRGATFTIVLPMA